MGVCMGVTHVGVCMGVTHECNVYGCNTWVGYNKWAGFCPGFPRVVITNLVRGHTVVRCIMHGCNISGCILKYVVTHMGVMYGCRCKTHGSSVQV